MHRRIPLLSAIALLSWNAASLADPSGAVATVLTADETAQLLRVPSQIVVKLARAGSIPARQVGDDWRFSRVAVLQWLQGERFAYPVVPIKAATQSPAAAQRAAASDTQRDDDKLMIATELAALTGRGTEPSRLAQAGPAPTSQSAPALSTIGEQPGAKTAEEVALRDQGALLKGGATTLELGLSYARAERSNFPLLRLEQNTVSTAVTARYGVKDDLQITARLPYLYRRNTTFSNATLTPGADVSASDSQHYAGDLAVSLLGVALRERSGWPNLVWSIDAVAPTGPGDRGLGVGLVATKSYDPMVLYAGASYLYGSSTDANDARRVLAQHNLGFNLGYTYAVNDAVALSGAFIGTYRNHRRTAETLLPPSRETQQLQFGVTWQLGRGLFLEPSVAFGIGGSAPDSTFALNLPYTF